MRKVLVALLTISMILAAFSSCTTRGDTTDPQQLTGSAREGKYADLIVQFRSVIEFRLSASFEEEYNGGKGPVSPSSELTYEWNCMLVESISGLKNPTLASFGYMVADLNNDGASEIVFMREDDTVLAIYTQIGEQAHLIGAYWSEKRCVILENGDLFVLSSGGATNFYYKVETYKGGSLLSVREFGLDNGRFYQKDGEDIVDMSEEEWNQLLASYPRWSNGARPYMQAKSLVFTPLVENE